MSGMPGRTLASMKRKSYDFQKAGTIWRSKCHVYVDSGSAWLELPLLIILANFARIIALKNHPKLGWILKDMSGQLCRKLRQSQPEKSGQVGQAFLQQLPLKLSGSERDNYSQLGNNFKTATSRQLVGKWAMTVLKMRPKLGLISRMSLVRSRDRNSRQIVGNYYEEGYGQKLGQVGPTFL